ncbi:glycosyltransferase family 2 protein [Heyndrickxia ginsengihumi]|uniref:Glycosyltransferase family 2 protein n=1 Tax=Heyndrickxia ginsengihumi TaxID=363870 RepID=A0A0A6VCJ2_9BACI|nr:glycosyltransferase [Heyndrickxia ginsengihumi]KHD86010.1 N-acetylglucosaminyltransferase [Heyndrickxia ginsengihumi]MBE6182940.1 glycosyltransferase family 2 protein [Bacillus sp. (in: firmicutes)]MCM3022837.1 glycosyltransferase family 2 protein [Heyndrickxia ginsengihumi]NEY20104.1 glycosyltransferase family 2 protein [Heyndrickxia ginsengihumi]
MKLILVVIMFFFWFLLIYYSILTVAGVLHRLKKRRITILEKYPSVAILIPAHNEGIVIKNTLEAMIKLEYPGKLDVYVLDDASTDDTASIIKHFSDVFTRIHYIKVPPGQPKGKSRVLNYGLSITTSDYFLVFDADNQPEKNAVVELVHAAETTVNAAGAVGYVKTINANRNLLTRMIAIEFQVFQLLMQSGRWKAFKTGSLAGTNMLLKREVIEKLGGYDPFALAEDAELTIRITAINKKLPVVPQSRTWEQEPEKMNIFIRQRTRWLIGNLYLLEKAFHDLSYWKGKTLVHSIQHVLTYFLFVLLLLFSDIWFILGIFGYKLPEFQSPLLLFWFMSYIIYTVQIISSLVLELTVTPMNVFVATIMYFTYAQLFLLLLMKSACAYLWSRYRKKTIKWDKTERFRGEPM